MTHTSGCQVSKDEKSQGVAFPLMHAHAYGGSGCIPRIKNHSIHIVDIRDDAIET
jgi:hypothetical protein